MGWSGPVNGELVRKAQRAKFDVIIAEDEGFFGESLGKTAQMSISVFVVANEQLIASNLPRIIPNICARLLESMDKSLYVMGGKRAIKKITKGLPQPLVEVPQDCVKGKFSRSYMLIIRTPEIFSPHLEASLIFTEREYELLTVN